MALKSVNGKSIIFDSGKWKIWKYPWKLSWKSHGIKFLKKDDRKYVGCAMTKKFEIMV